MVQKWGRKCFPAFVLKKLFVLSYLHIRDSYQILSKFVHIYQSYKCLAWNLTRMRCTPSVFKIVSFSESFCTNFLQHNYIFDTPFYAFNQWSHQNFFEVHTIFFDASMYVPWITLMSTFAIKPAWKRSSIWPIWALYVGLNQNASIADASCHSSLTSSQFNPQISWNESLEGKLDQAE